MIKLIADVPYKTTESRTLLLDILMPDPLPSEPAPLIVDVHGGGWIEGGKDANRNAALARAGFVTASIQYRLTNEAPHPAQIEDCRDAVRWLRAHAAEYGIDTTRVGVVGGSAGGHLVSLLGTTGSHEASAEGGAASANADCAVQAVVNLCGPTDILPTEYVPYEGPHTGGATINVYDLLLGGPIAERTEVARDASPIAWVTANVPPFLILHCEDDDVVPIRHATAMRDALRAVGGDVTLITYPDGGHGFTGHWEDTERATVEFFQSKLNHSDSAN